MRGHFIIYWLKKNNDGKTPIDIAHGKGFKSIGQVLADVVSKQEALGEGVGVKHKELSKQLKKEASKILESSQQVTGVEAKEKHQSKVQEVEGKQAGADTPLAGHDVEANTAGRDAEIIDSWATRVSEQASQKGRDSSAKRG